MPGLTPEQLLEQLNTRGFQEGGGPRTPLREFIGTLDSITGDLQERQGRTIQYAMYNFSELEVIQSTEPYPMPIAQLPIPISNTKRSQMGAWGASIDKLINVDAAGQPLPDGDPNVKKQGYLIGKRLRVKLTPGHKMWDRNAGKEVDRDMFEVIQVVGESGVSPAVVSTAPQPIPDTTGAPVNGALGRALQLLEDKSLQEWYQVVFADPVVKADGALVTKIIQNALIPAMEAAGTVSKDANGKYHVVK
jgi:hypothetical protein